ncbi:hypothetical protein Rhe02_36290 [Rhizocola hellebori]|uniref:Uncharacterized protein n=1 Tax=Rhizocola hellebori TaxID=1392758 RepID=A0A8J3VGV1_9ACTN|nr:hypothetical protein Rhe02_36290 [Rhizocola hellebori]
MAASTADPRPNQPWLVPSSKSLAITTTGSTACAIGVAATIEATTHTAVTAAIHTLLRLMLAAFITLWRKPKVSEVFRGISRTIGGADDPVNHRNFRNFR